MSVEMLQGSLEYGDPVRDSRSFRQCLGQFATGVTVVTAELDGKRAGMTANSFSSLSLDPPLILWSVGRSSSNFAFFQKVDRFAINILASSQVHVAQKFSSKVPDRFDGVGWSAGRHGAPTIDEAIAVFECKVETIYEGGDHVIIVGRVESFGRLSGEPLVFAQGRYAVAADHPDFKPRAPARADALPERQDGLMSISMLLLLAHYVSSAALEVHRSAEGLTHAQTRVLYGLSSTRSVSLKQLLERTYVSATAAEDALEELIERSCVVREIDGCLRLTELGLERRNAMIRRIQRFEEELLGHIPPEDREKLRGLLTEFIVKIRPSAASEWFSS